jgi:hypothetical protein
MRFDCCEMVIGEDHVVGPNERMLDVVFTPASLVRLSKIKSAKNFFHNTMEAKKTTRAGINITVLRHRRKLLIRHGIYAAVC